MIEKVGTTEFRFLNNKKTVVDVISIKKSFKITESYHSKKVIILSPKSSLKNGLLFLRGANGLLSELICKF